MAWGEIVLPEPFIEMFFTALTRKIMEAKTQKNKNSDITTQERECLRGAIAVLDNYGNRSVIKTFTQFFAGETDRDGKGIGSGLERLTADVTKGDLHRLESILTDQAVSLNAIFSALAIRSHSNMEEGYGEASERYMRLALKAQNQCRTTIDTIAQIKNPRHTVITKQANISNGPQQVNNTLNQISEQESKIPENSETNQNKLLSHEQAETPYLDSRAALKASGDKPPMATVETVHRAAH